MYLKLLYRRIFNKKLDLKNPKTFNAVGILGQTKFLGKQRYAFLKFGNSFNRPVQGVVEHGVLWCRGLMTGLLEVSRYLPAPLIERKLM